MTRIKRQASGSNDCTVVVSAKILFMRGSFWRVPLHRLGFYLPISFQ